MPRSNHQSAIKKTTGPRFGGSSPNPPALRGHRLTTSRTQRGFTPCVISLSPTSGVCVQGSFVHNKETPDEVRLSELWRWFLQAIDDRDGRSPVGVSRLSVPTEKSVREDVRCGRSNRVTLSPMVET